MKESALEQARVRVLIEGPTLGRCTHPRAAPYRTGVRTGRVTRSAAPCAVPYAVSHTPAELQQPCSTTPGPGPLRPQRRSCRRRGQRCSRACGPARCLQTCLAGAALRRSLQEADGHAKRARGRRRLRHAPPRPTPTSSSLRSRHVANAARATRKSCVSHASTTDAATKHAQHWALYTTQRGVRAAKQNTPRAFGHSWTQVDGRGGAAQRGGLSQTGVAECGACTHASPRLDVMAGPAALDLHTQNHLHSRH